MGQIVGQILGQKWDKIFTLAMNRSKVSIRYLDMWVLVYSYAMPS